MNICVYGAASNEVADDIILKTELLGAEMAKRKHTLIFGGGASGMMGAVARGVKSQKGEIIGVAPEFFNSDGVLFEGCTDFYFTEDMRSRKALLEQKSDAFVVTPGGIGTFDEFFEILTLRTLGRHTKPIAVYNINGYYNTLKELLNTAVKGNFMKQSVLELIEFFDQPEPLLDYVENYKGRYVTAFDMKAIDERNR